MLTMFLPAVAAVLLVSCALIVVARIQKRLIKTWVAAGSQTSAFAPEHSDHLHQWSREFGLRHDLRRTALIVLAICSVVLIGYMLSGLAISS